MCARMSCLKSTCGRNSLCVPIDLKQQIAHLCFCVVCTRAETWYFPRPMPSDIPAQSEGSPVSTHHASPLYGSRGHCKGIYALDVAVELCENMLLDRCSALALLDNDIDHQRARGTPEARDGRLDSGSACVYASPRANADALFRVVPHLRSVSSDMAAFLADVHALLVGFTPRMQHTSTSETDTARHHAHPWNIADVLAILREHVCIRHYRPGEIVYDNARGDVTALEGNAPSRGLRPTDAGNSAMPQHTTTTVGRMGSTEGVPPLLWLVRGACCHCHCQHDADSAGCTRSNTSGGWHCERARVRREITSCDACSGCSSAEGGREQREACGAADYNNAVQHGVIGPLKTKTAFFGLTGHEGRVIAGSHDTLPDIDGTNNESQSGAVFAVLTRAAYDQMLATHGATANALHVYLSRKDHAQGLG